MITQRKILLKDPYLLDGEQLTFSYGIISYIVSGLLYPVFDYLTVDIIIFILILINTFLITKFLKKDTITASLLILSLAFFTTTDSYVSAFSLTLFWYSLYQYKRKKHWEIPMIIACINHPFTLIPASYFVLKDKKTWSIITSIIIMYFLIISFFFSKNSEIEFYYPVVIIFRSIILLSPILIKEDLFSEITRKISNSVEDYEESINKILKNLSIDSKKVKKRTKKFNKEVEKIIKKFWYSRQTIIRIILIIIIVSIITMEMMRITTNLTLPHTELLTNDVSENFPKNISGSIRVVDYMFLPAIYHFPKNNIVLGVGSFRENNPVKFSPTIYRTISEYEEATKNYGFVLHCKYCNPLVNDWYFLNKHYNIIWENKYYSLYNISSKN